MLTGNAGAYINEAKIIKQKLFTKIIKMPRYKVV
jgi:hypothetical protein